MYLRSTASTVAGIFFSISIVSSVLACALWNFQKHSGSENLIYGGGVAASFILNLLISISLVQGIRTQSSQLFLPYIVCSTIHLVVSIAAIFFFVLSFLDHIFNGNDLTDLYGIGVFSLLAVFWTISLNVVRDEREKAKKYSGEHVRLADEEFI